MFKNLKAEMARNGHKNADVAKILGISRQSYEMKVRTGKIKVTEAKKLCELYHSDFNYLFETESEAISA